MIDFGRAGERFRRELADVVVPPMALVAREIPTPPAIADIDDAVRQALSAVDVTAGDIAVTVGSRGIARIADIVTAVVAALRQRGARPFIVPAMGSHGGSTAQGQLDVLAHLGITEQRVGAPIRAAMDTVRLGVTDGGTDVFVASEAMRADAIVPVNRVKPHTAFRGPIESGPTKMLAVGLGKIEGARSVHAPGWDAMHETVPAAARVVLERAKVSFAIAIIENADEEPCRIEAIPAAALLAREPSLLEEAKRNLARLPLDAIDVLVVDRVGKSISGTSADPNVTGRFAVPYVSGGPAIRRLVYLSMADDDGNGTGVGLADVISLDLAARWDPLPTYLNAMTSTTAVNARLPMVMPTKELAVAAALRMCPDVHPDSAVVVRIADTLHLGKLWMSPAALAAMREPYRILRAPGPMSLEDGYAA